MACAADHLLQWQTRGDGEELEPIILLDHVKAGDKVLVAVKLLHTADVKRIEGAHLRIEFPEGRPSPKTCARNSFQPNYLSPLLRPVTVRN